MQIPYGHAHIDGLVNMASHDVAMIHASQVPYDVCDALKKKGIKLLECPSRNEAKETLAINYVAIEPGLVAVSYTHLSRGRRVCLFKPVENTGFSAVFVL